MKIFTNHLGYETYGHKKCIIEAPHYSKLSKYSIRTAQGDTVYEGQPIASGTVDRWKDWYFWEIDFSDFSTEGTFQIAVGADGELLLSEAFEVRDYLLTERCVPDVLSYFKSQRCTGKYDRSDRAIPFEGERSDRVDVHGGWYDASGDVSKYLSHLSYANYMNPQQTPMVVWNMLYAADLLDEAEDTCLRHQIGLMREEAVYGADFLLRMQDAAEYFYMTVFDTWSKDTGKRGICAFRTQKGYRSDDYQAGYRQGGGIAIAALARTFTLGMNGDYTSAEYLEAAERGMAHLEAHNCEYLNDGKENIIDDYCALLAATELYHATKKREYLEIARKRRTSLTGRLTDDANYTGWWRADDSGNRPYFHAAEAGLPAIALLRYLDIEPDAQQKRVTQDAIRTSLSFELEITNEVANPFGYARQYVKDTDGEKRGAFFFPHNNESGYWWQGENARLGSLASAAFLVSRECSRTGAADEAFRQKLHKYAADQVDWILGLNPFDACMLQGRGRNNPPYTDTFPNAPGGVCNGITGGFDDEHDIDLRPERHAGDPLHSWRWGEQWIPHGAWLILALAASAAIISEKRAG